jgi:hypothetical protein
VFTFDLAIRKAARVACADYGSMSGVRIFVTAETKIRAF